MHNSTHEFEACVLVKGKPVTEVVHNGQTFIEGRRNSSYELFFRNNSRKRVLVVPSVDGLSVIDGKPAGVESPGFVVRPHSEVTVPGWTLNGSEAAEFIFHAQNSSRHDEETYVEAMGEDRRNQGAIGFMVFREQRATRSHEGDKVYFPQNAATKRKRSRNIRGYTTAPGMAHHVDNTRFDPDRVRNVMHSTLEGMSPQSFTGDGLIGSSYTVTTSTNMDDLGNIPNSGSWVNVDIDDEKSLGTGFGDAVEFETRSVEFRRETSHCALFAFYYDTIKNLRRAGVPVEEFRRHYTETYSAGPNPFPDSPEVTGATPPSGYRGRARYRKRRS